MIKNPIAALINRPRSSVGAVGASAVNKHDLTEEQQKHYDAFLRDHQAWFEDLAVSHAHRMTKTPRWLDLSNLPEDPYEISLERETRYRRGYVHGYSQGMDDAMTNPDKPTSAWRKAARFFDTKLMKWGYESSASMTLAPRFNRYEKE